MDVTDLRWFGPRPLTEGEPLLGRKQELEQLLDRTRTNDLVVLTAATGVGKTSFVSAGAVPTLKRSGYTILGLQEWPTSTARANLARYGSNLDVAADRLYRAALQLELDDTPLAEALRTKGGGEPLVILDQVEEVLRYQPAVTTRMLQLASETAHTAHVGHVVIGRSEYLQDLVSAVDVPGTATWSLPLREIVDEKTIRSIIRRGAVREDEDRRPLRTQDGQLDILIDDDATSFLVDAWLGARQLVATQRAQRLGAEGVPEVGLLQLQAVLWCLRTWLERQPGDGRVTLAHVKSWVADRASHQQGGSAEDSASWLMQDALSEYVSDAVKRLLNPTTTTFGRVRRPFAWGAGPQVTLARSASQLSAAGFKQPQTLAALLPAAVEDELRRPQAREVRDLLADLPQELPAAGFTPDESTVDVLESADPLSDLGTVGDIGAGVALGWPKSRVVREMVDALHAALRTLSSKEVNVLREFDRPGQPIYELTHDGMGAALQTWAEHYLRGLTAQVGGIAAQTGRAAVRLTVDRAAVEAECGPDAPQLWGNVRFGRGDDDASGLTLHGLRWNGSAVMDCTFTDVTFENCDFTGASFIGCTLRRVRFIGCKLTAGLFLNCTLDNVCVEMTGQQDANDANLLTVKNPRGEATFELRRLKGTSGVVLSELNGGRFLVSGSRVRHLIVDANSPTTLALQGTVAWAVSASPPVEPDPDADSTLSLAPVPNEALG